MNNVTISGRVSNLASLKIFGENEAVAYIPIAVDREYLSRERKEEFKKEGKRTADFMKIKVTGKNATFYAESCYVGRLIEVKGRIEENPYDYIDNDGTKVKVRENVIRPDKNIITFLSWDNTQSSDNDSGINTDGFSPVNDEDDPF